MGHIVLRLERKGIDLILILMGLSGFLSTISSLIWIRVVSILVLLQSMMKLLSIDNS